MKSCKETRLHLARRATEKLLPTEEAMLERHLNGCSACREQAAAIDAFTGGMGELRKVIFRPSQSARQRFLAGLRRQRQETKVGLQQTDRPSRCISVRRRASSRAGSRRASRQVGVSYYAAALAAAAVLALTVSLVWHGRNRSEVRQRPGTDGAGQHVAVVKNSENVLALVAGVGGRPVLLRAGRRLPLLDGGGLHAGDVLRTGENGHAVISYLDGSSVVVNRNSEVELDEFEGGKRLSLERGEIYAEIARQPRGLPMVLNPGRVDQVRVVGTAFELTRQEAVARLLMMEGQVAFGPPAEAIEVQGGQISQVEGSRSPSAPRAVETAEVAPWRATLAGTARPAAHPSAVPPASRPPLHPAAEGRPVASEPPAVPSLPLPGTPVTPLASQKKPRTDKDADADADVDAGAVADAEPDEPQGKAGDGGDVAGKGKGKDGEKDEPHVAGKEPDGEPKEPRGKPEAQEDDPRDEDHGKGNRGKAPKAPAPKGKGSAKPADPGNRPNK